MSGRGIASFVAGFGTGFITAKDKAEERKRQEKKDKQAEDLFNIQMKGYQRAEDKAVKNDAIDAEVAAVPTKSYKNATSMTPDDVRKMVGGVASKDDPNYKAEGLGDNIITDEAAKQYMTAAAPTQINNHAAYYAKEGISDNFNGKTAVADPAGGQTQLAKPSDAQDIKPWKVLEKQGAIRRAVGTPEQMELANKAFALAATAKSEAVTTALSKALNQAGDKELNVAKMLSEWDNEDFPYTDVRLDRSANPERPKLFGTLNGKEVLLQDYSTVDMPKGSTVLDHMVKQIRFMAKPDSIYDSYDKDKALRREDERNAVADAHTAKQEAIAAADHKMKEEEQPLRLQSLQADVIGKGIENKYKGAEAQARIDSSRSSTNKNNREASADSIDLSKEKNVNSLIEDLNTDVGNAMVKKGLFKPVEGKTMFTTTSKNLDSTGKEISTGKVSYKINPTLKAHMGALLRGGVPAEKIPDILTDRNKSNGQYNWKVKSKNAKGKTITGYPVRDSSGNITAIIPID